MTKHRPRMTGTIHGPHVDAIAAMLTHALHGHGRGYGSTGIFIASRQLSGADDGGATEILCGQRKSYRSDTELMELNASEHLTADKILTMMLESPTADPWSDLVVVVRLRPGGAQVASVRSPIFRLLDTTAARHRREFLGSAPIDRLDGLLRLAGLR